MFLVLLFAAMLNAVLQIIVVKQQVALFTPSYIVLKVCNPSSIVIQASSLTITGVEALDPLPISIGRVAPLMCKEFTFHFIPTSTKPMKAKLTYMYMGQKGPVTGNAEYLIPLDLKIPVLQSVPVSIKLLKDGKLQLTFKIINPSAFTFNGTIEIMNNSTNVILIRTIIPARSEKTFSLSFNSLVSSLNIKYLMNGIAIGGDKIVFPKPKVNVILSIANDTLSLPGKVVVKINSPILLRGVLSLQGNCLPLPQEKRVIVYQHKRVSFNIEKCESPAKLKVELTTPIGRWSTAKTIPLKKPTVALSTLTLQSGAVNKLKVIVVGSRDLIKLQIPNAIVKPLIGKPNTTFTVIPLPIEKMKQITATVTVGSVTTSFNLLLLPFNPTIDFSLNKESLVEGTREKVTLCAKNSWTYDIENATLTFSMLGKSVTSTFNFPQGSERCLSLNVTSPWYPARVDALASLEVLGYTISKKFELQVVKNPNLITLNVTCPKEVKWNQRVLKLGLKASGEGEIKNLEIKVSGDFIQEKILKYKKIKDGFADVISVPISISKKTKVININIASNYDLCLYVCKMVNAKETCKVRVKLPPPPTFKVSLKSYTLFLSETNRVPILLTSKGEYKDLMITVKSKNAIVIGSNSVDLGKFNGTKEVVFYLSPQSQSPVLLTVILNVVDIWGNKNTFEYTFNLVVRKPRQPKITINVLTPKLMIGTNKVKLLISNVGNKRATNVNINIVSPDVVILKPTIFLKTMLPGQKILRVVEISVPAALAGGNAQITASALYDNLTSTYNFKLPVHQGPQLKISDINIIPRYIPLGTQATLSMVLTNQGDDRAFSVKVMLTIPKNFNIVGPSRIFLGAVGAQASLPVAFTIVPKEGTKPGTYVGKIIVTYNYAGSQYKVEQPVTIIVISKQTQMMQKASVDWRYFAAAGFVLLIIVIWGVRRARSASTSPEGLEE